MKDFLLIYRTDEATMKGLGKRSPEEIEASMRQWMNWIGGIAAQNKLTDRGNRLVSWGKVITNESIIADGPYTEIKEFVVGYSLVKGSSLEDATELAKGCPVFGIGGNVEIREISVM